MKFGEMNIMNNLHHIGAWFQFNKLNIHREVSIRWFKYISTTVILQHRAKLRIDNQLRNVKLEPDKSESLTIADTSHNHYDP